MSSYHGVPQSSAGATISSVGTATTADQVTIDVENGIVNNHANNRNDQLNVGLIAVDGRRHGHQRHGSGGSGHHHSGHESDTHATDETRRSGGGHRQQRRRRSRSRSPSPHRSKRATDTGTPSTEKDVVNNTRDVEPLLVTHNTDVHHKKHTELDEDSDEGVAQHEQNPGVDDGFFVGNRPENGVAGGGGGGTDDHPHTNNHVPHDIPFPYAPGFNPNVVGEELEQLYVILDGNGNPQVIPDINVYQQKKNLAQGMMDLALLSANANQLRYVVETYARHPYYWFSLISISISLILQVVVGVGLILNSRYNVKNKEQICRADKINNFTVIGIFLITAVNVFITAFGVAPSESRPN